MNGVFRYTQAKELCRVWRHSVLRGYVQNFSACTHGLCAFTAARIGNIIKAKWKEFDLERDQPA